MARLPFVTRDDIDEGEKGAYDAFLAARSQRPNSGSEGPYALLLHMPELAQRIESLRLYIRDEKSLRQDLQELVMITVAREMGCGYIWYAHAAAARKVGVRGDIIDNLRDNRELTGLSADEQTVVNYTRELLRSRKVSGATFDRAKERLGRRGTLTLTSLVACYAMMAYAMNALELEAPTRPGEPNLPL